MLPREKRVILDDSDRTHGVQPWEARKQSAHADWPTPDSNEPAVLINTSGSTGQPKFVVHAQDTLAATTHLLCKHFGPSADDVIVAPLQLAHASGIFCSLSFVQTGVPFVMLQSADRDTVLDSIERYRATWLLGFPYQYARLPKAQRAKPRDVSSLRVCLTGADACQNVAECLASYKVPEGLRVIDALPRNALGKIDRRAMERMVGEDGSTGSRSEAAPSHAVGKQLACRVAQKK